MKKQTLTPFLEKIHLALLDIANEFNQHTVETLSLVSHWAYSLAFEDEFIDFGTPTLKLRVVETLKEHNLYINRDSFKSHLLAEVPFPPPSKKKFKFIDLFAGIGGFRLALQKQHGFCAFSSEWDRSAQNTYLKNYGELPFGDITQFSSPLVSDKLLELYIPDHDILAAGFPCQPFSHAGVSARNSIGNKHGFECDTQGTLFFDIMRIVAVKKPKVLFLENVRNIQRHDQGKTFEIIKDSIEEQGYTFKHEIIDSSTLVPQRRVRCYMVCFRSDIGIDFTFPKFNGDLLPLKSILQEDPAIVDKFTISDKLWSGHMARTSRNIARGTGFTAHTADIEKPSNTIVARYGKDGKECLIPQKNKNPRMLTPRECARLQGYPEKFILPEARTPAYKQFGNSVAVPVVTRIAEEIVAQLKAKEVANEL